MMCLPRIGSHQIDKSRTSKPLAGWTTSPSSSYYLDINVGGHQNCQIWQSFKKLLPIIKPDMALLYWRHAEVAEWKQYRRATSCKCDGNIHVPVKLKECVGGQIDLWHKMKTYIEFTICQKQWGLRSWE